MIKRILSWASQIAGLLNSEAKPFDSGDNRRKERAIILVEEALAYFIHALRKNKNTPLRIMFIDDDNDIIFEMTAKDKAAALYQRYPKLLWDRFGDRLPICAIAFAGDRTDAFPGKPITTKNMTYYIVRVWGHQKLSLDEIMALRDRYYLAFPRVAQIQAALEGLYETLQEAEHSQKEKVPPELLSRLTELRNMAQGFERERGNPNIAVLEEYVAQGYRLQAECMANETIAIEMHWASARLLQLVALSPWRNIRGQRQLGRQVDLPESMLTDLQLRAEQALPDKTAENIDAIRLWCSETRQLMAALGPFMVRLENETGFIGGLMTPVGIKVDGSGYTVMLVKENPDPAEADYFYLPCITRLLPTLKKYLPASCHIIRQDWQYITVSSLTPAWAIEALTAAGSILVVTSMPEQIIEHLQSAGQEVGVFVSVPDVLVESYLIVTATRPDDSDKRVIAEILAKRRALFTSAANE